MAGRGTYTVEERVQIVKEHLAEGKTISELAVEHGLGYRLVYDWRSKSQGRRRRNCGCGTHNWNGKFIC